MSMVPKIGVVYHSRRHFKPVSLVSSKAIAAALKKFSVSAELINLDDIRCVNKGGKTLVLAKNKDLTKFSALYFRKTWPVKSMNSILEYLEHKGVRIVDRKLTHSFDNSYKLRCMIKSVQNKIATPKFYYQESYQESDYAVIQRKLGIGNKKPFVFKSAMESRGRMIFLIRNGKDFASALKAVKNTSSDGEMFAQEYIEAMGDYRVFVIGKRALGAAYKQKMNNDFRSNVAVGGIMHAAKMTKVMRDLSLKAARMTETEIAGVDFIEKGGKLYLLEVNRSPQFSGFVAATGIDVPYEIAKYLVGLIKK